VCQIQRFDFDCNLVRGSDAKINNTSTDTAGIRFKSSIDLEVLNVKVGVFYAITLLL
jgi:hypothetical protein